MTRWTPSATEDEPLHVARFGDRFDAQGVLAGSKDAGALYRLSDEVPHQASGRLPPGRHRRPARPCRPAGRRAAVRALLAPVRQLAPLRRPAQERPARPCAWRVQGQSPPSRVPWLRGPPGAGLPQMVGQDAGRPPGRPQELAPGHSRQDRHRTSQLRTWEPVAPGDPDYMEHARRLLHIVADRQQWQAALNPGQAQSGHRPTSRPFSRQGRPHEKRQAEPAREIGCLTVAEAADVHGTSERFPRRLISERRIRFVRVGRHVRIPESALQEFIAAGLVEPIRPKRRVKAALWASDDLAGCASSRPGGTKPATQDRTGLTTPCAGNLRHQERGRRPWLVVKTEAEDPGR